ncbi:carbohydrate kinase family protein [Actinomadura parmotrematis]|uniref:Carbohydrate kinase family protein n=1 Tax=Actinomadura parmotrematis TaxID=2864039 RepID=A0ABS7FZS9_9ACTN|nr:PfkB family carbohydrate kinase [Actinomadura parmotrematis]MBW8485460.1 carbohydrate kinase family protein [Actinomadura parmotrematis]
MTVVTLGAHIVDVLARPVEGIPAGQDTVVVDQVKVTAAGAAAGTAVSLARLGNRVVSLGAIGDDDLGTLLAALLTREGVDVSGLVRRTDEQTSASILPIRPDGGRPSFHVPGANLTFGAAMVDPGLLAAADAVHIGGPDVAFGLNDPAFFGALEAARAAGTVVTMDLLSNLPDLVAATAAFLPHVDHFLPNEEQALAMTGAADPVQAARELLDQGPSSVLVTLGEHGSLVASADGVERLPALPVEVVDTTGCGDAYCAGFITGLLHGRPLGEAARWGTAAAATVAQGLGTAAGLDGLDAALALLDA